jgi:cysteine-rich repeat protein
VKPTDSICTAPCDAAHPCPTGFLCLSVSQSFDVPTGRSYCARARAICGNHTVETGEECDDGNTVSGDGCSATCKREGCGNGILEVGEECEPGLATSSDIPCSSTCTYTTPAGTHVIAPMQPGTPYANLVAPATGGNVVTAMLLTGTPTTGTNQVVSRRLSQQGATADPMVNLAEGADLSTPHLSVSSGGVAIVINRSTGPLAFIGAADGTGLHAVTPFPAGPTFTKMTVAAGATKLAVFGQAWFPTDGHTAAVVIPVSWAGVAEPLVEVSTIKLGSFDLFSAEYAASGELALTWDETCTGCGFKVATLPSTGGAVTTPTKLPDGSTGTSGQSAAIAGASTPTVGIFYATLSPAAYAIVSDGVGRFDAGAWKWQTWPLDTSLTERRSAFVSAPDGSLVAAEARNASGTQGMVEVRAVRAVGAILTYTTIATAQTSNPQAGVDRAGTIHVLYSAPPVANTAGNKLQHAQVTSAGTLQGPDVLWTGGAAQVLTSPDGDVYGFEAQRMLLVHLGP